jgi:hypothetical protein
MSDNIQVHYAHYVNADMHATYECLSVELFLCWVHLEN